MKIRKPWGNVMKFMGMATLFCVVLLVFAIAGPEKRGLTGKTESTAASARQATTSGEAKNNQHLTEAYGKLPLSFEENQGQTAYEVRYVSHGRGYELFLTPQEVVIALRTSTQNALAQHRAALRQAGRRSADAIRTTAVRMRLEGANPDPQISGAERLPTHVNYFIGNDPKNWHTDVPAYARVKYAGIYPGIDLVFYGNQRRLEYDYVVAPGADPKAIQLKIEGARKMRINSRGDLVLSVAGGEVELQKPLVYQEAQVGRHEIAAKYLLTGNHRVTFSVADYDRRKPLILDPVLNYSTYLGGTAGEGGFPMGIAVDAAGDAFVAGQTTSIDFPPGTKAGVAINPNPNPNNGASFIAELSPDGTALLYSTYLVGPTTSLTNGGDGATSVAVDSTGKLVYVSGFTVVTGFPTVHPLPATGGQNSANTTTGTCYVAKLDLNQTGNAELVFSSYLGGGAAGGEFCNSIAVDANANAYVVGATFSATFPVTSNAYQSTFNAGNVGNAFGSAFLSKIDTNAFSLVYSTYLSGNAAHAATANSLGYGDQAFGVAVDSSNNAYVTGGTTSTNSTGFPSSANAYLTAPPPGNILGTVFVSKINTAGSGTSSLLYSTYLSGSTEEQGNAIALGPGPSGGTNIAYVTGFTNSIDFPTTPKAFDTKGGAKAFVSLIDTTKSATGSLVYSTNLGGTTGSDIGFGIKADSAGNAYVAGTATSTDFPTTPGAFQRGLTNTNGTPFFAKLAPKGNQSADLLYSTFFGGSGDKANPDNAYGIDIDKATTPNAYIMGQTHSTDMPVFHAFQTTLKGPSDAFVAKLSPIPTLDISPAVGTTIDFGTVGTGTTSAAQTVTLTNNTNGPISFTSAATSGTNAADFTVTKTGCTGGIVVGTPCVVSITFKPTIVAPPSEVATLTITDGDSTNPQVFSLIGKGANLPPDFTISASPTSVTVSKGSVAPAVTITVTPVNGFNSAVALTCTGAPAKSSCALNPTSVTPAPPAAATSTLTFTAHAMIVPVPVSRRVPPVNMIRVVPLVVALMLLFLMRSTQRFRTRLAMVSAIFICLTLSACSGSDNGTARGTYTLTVTGTGGGVNHSTPVTVIVN